MPTNPLDTIAETEPLVLVQGDTVTWKRTDLSSDYPNDKYTLSYEFRSRSPSGSFTITATADASDYLISVAKATTATYAASDRARNQSGYEWSAYMTKTTGERIRIDYGTLDVTINLAAQAAGFDGRSHAQKMLDAIVAALEGRADKTELQYTVNGRTIQRMTHDQLIQARVFYAREVARERGRERIRRGQPTGTRVLTRFGTPT